MSDVATRFQRLKRTTKRECALRVSDSCASTYDGDADEAKVAGLGEIECFRVFDGDEKSDSVDIHICAPCLQTQIQRGWAEIS